MVFCLRYLNTAMIQNKTNNIQIFYVLFLFFSFKSLIFSNKNFIYILRLVVDNCCFGVLWHGGKVILFSCFLVALGDWVKMKNSFILKLLNLVG
jgi:hypothetical protein